MSITLKKPDEAFGGINIIAAGNFAQLPSIKSRTTLYISVVELAPPSTNSIEDQKISIEKAL